MTGVMDALDQLGESTATEGYSEDAESEWCCTALDEEQVAVERGNDEAFTVRSPETSLQSVRSKEDATQTQTLPEKPPMRINNWNSPVTSPTDSSNMEKRACRICQSESGVMVRPCACSGTMGDIHEHCLNEWLSRSNNGEICEICHQKYCKSGNVLQPIWKWHKPNIEMTNVIETASVVCLTLCLWYMLALTHERQFIERVFYAGIPPRSPDIARILVTLLIVGTLAGGLTNIVGRLIRYVHKQRAIHFVDAHFNKKNST